MKRLLIVCLFIGKMYASEMQHLDMNDHSIIDKSSYFAVYAQKSNESYMYKGKSWIYSVPEYTKYIDLVNAQKSNKDLLVFFRRNNQPEAMFLVNAFHKDQEDSEYIAKDFAVVSLAQSKLDKQYKPQAIKVVFNRCIKTNGLLAWFYNEFEEVIARENLGGETSNYLSQASMVALSEYIDLSRLTYVTDRSASTIFWPKTVYKMVRGLNESGDLEFYEIQS
jgi:hypothetical protein